MGIVTLIKVEIHASLHDVDSFDGCRSYFAWNWCVCYLILCEAVGAGGLQVTSVASLQGRCQLLTQGFWLRVCCPFGVFNKLHGE